MGTLQLAPRHSAFRQRTLARILPLGMSSRRVRSVPLQPWEDANAEAQCAREAGCASKRTICASSRPAHGRVYKEQKVVRRLSQQHILQAAGALTEPISMY